MASMSINKLAWAALVIADASAFWPPSSFCYSTHGIISSSSRHPPSRQQQQQFHNNAKPQDLWHSVATKLGGLRQSYGRVVSLLGQRPAQGEEETDLVALKELKQQKLAEWKAMIESGELEEAVRDALDQDVMEQEEAQEVGSRRTKRKDRVKEELGAKGGRQPMRAKLHDFSDLEEMFGGAKQDDWRDGAATGADTAGHKTAPETAVKKRSGSIDTGNERAMKVVSGLGLQVMPSKAPRQEVQEEFREEEGDERIGGVDRVNEEGDEDGVRKLITGIRKHEKGGKENAEKVIAMVVSAAERDGVRDDNLFSFAIKSLARMGRLDLGLRVNEIRARHIKSGQLCNHDRSTTSGLSVALLRAGDELAALDLFEAAVTPAPSLSLARAQDRDDDRDEVELDEDDVVAAEAEVLPELLSFYLERAQRESSQEASKGIRQTIDRALRQRDFDPEGGAAMTEENWGILSRPLPVTAYNQLIRRLGKAERLSDVFEVLDRMAGLEVEPDHETLEFVTNAAVKEVEFETRAVSMKTLPAGKNALPEVVFMGRSNVGKSSLVNMLVNRKALAPTSAIPGFTQHFNYYAVNKGRRRSPSFFLVDVPGLGYARVDDGRMDSWKSTLQRYLGVRETLKVVFHLVDVRTGLQPADTNLISLMMNENKGRSSYVMVITKCDKVSQNKLVEVEKEIRQALNESGFPASTPVIATSAKSKRGRVELLSYLRLVFDVDRRKKVGGRSSSNDAGGDEAITGSAPANEKQAFPSQT